MPIGSRRWPTVPGKRGMTGQGLGGRRDGAGRPRLRFTARRGNVYIMERETIGALDPFHKPELWTVLSVSRDEIEFQAGDDIIVLRLPDTE